ncbi:MAG: tetratricopeptide repeat protein [Nitrososphaerales archaeon]
MGRFLDRSDSREETSNNQSTNARGSEFAKKDLYKKGINLMASEKLHEAIHAFDLALRIDPSYVDAWIKKGYCHFHLDDYAQAIASYDKALEIDLNNAEAWNMKGLAYYKMKNYEKAIECAEKAIDINPNDGMAWYNKACYLSLTRKIDESLDALKRAIEIDISYAKKAVKDRDFENARGEIIFRRIIEVVVLEAIRVGYDVVGKMVWITGMDREDIEEAINNLLLKGLIIRREKRGLGFGKEESYTLTRELAEKIGVEKERPFGGRPREIAGPVLQLKDLSEHIARTKHAVEKGDLQSASTTISKLIEPREFGNILIENFFEEHRDLRVYHLRMKDKGQDYLNANKSNIMELLSNIEAKVNEKIRHSTIT